VTAVRSLRPAAAAVIPLVALMWLVAGLVAAAAEGYDVAPTWLLVLNQLVLAPLAVGAAWWVGRFLGGIVMGAVLPLALVLLPPLGVLFAQAKHRDVYVDEVLTRAIGIADGASFPAATVALVAAALVLHSLSSRGRPLAAALAGAAAGASALLEPSSALLVVGIALAYAFARRPLEAAAFTAAVAAPLIIVAARTGIELEISLDAFGANMEGLREYYWSDRLLQWLPLAGAIGAARSSPAAALLLGGWFGAFTVAEGASRNLEIVDGSFLVAFLPALPSFCLLVACIPLLVPTGPAQIRRLGRDGLSPLLGSAMRARANRSRPPSAGRPGR